MYICDIFEFIYVCRCVYAHLSVKYWCVHAMVHVWSSEDNLWGQSLLVWDSISLLFAAACNRQFGFWASRESSISVSCFAIGLLGLQIHTTVPKFVWVLRIWSQVPVFGWWMLYPTSRLCSPPLTFFLNPVLCNTYKSYFVLKCINLNHIPPPMPECVCSCKSWRTTEGINLRSAVYLL